MNRDRLHELVDSLPEEAVVKATEHLASLVERSEVQKYKKGQRVRLREPEIIAIGVSVGEIGQVVEADPTLHPPRISVSFSNGTEADVHPRKLEAVD